MVAPWPPAPGQGGGYSDTNEAARGGGGKRDLEGSLRPGCVCDGGLREGSCSTGRKSRWHTTAREGTGASFSLLLMES